MRETERILEAYDSLKEGGIGSVLATVVHVEGSSYRRAGARMLVDEYGNITGAISGGCLEGDALRKALLAWEQGRKKRITYDTMDEKDAVVGAQLGCNGIIQVLFEPLDYTDENNPCELLRRTVSGGEARVIGVLFDSCSDRSQIGTAWLSPVSVDGGFDATPAGLRPVLEKASVEVLDSARSVFLNWTGDSSCRAFLQYWEPPLRLLIAGAGNDARDLSAQALLLGWEVTVFDGRPSHAHSGRFDASCQVVLTPPEEALRHIAVDHRCCFVLMSHNFAYDLAVLRLIRADLRIGYIGILGPREKYLRMKEDLQREGSALSAVEERRIFAPVGLNIGAETPAEIGLSILSEIQAFVSGVVPGHLRERERPIHDRTSAAFKRIEE